MQVLAEAAQRQLATVDFSGLAQAISQALGQDPLNPLLVEASEVDWESVEAAIEQGPESELAKSFDWNRIVLLLAILQYIAAGAVAKLGDGDAAAMLGAFGMATQAAASMISPAETASGSSPDQPAEG